jgi:DNA helicase-2/ATP-dependent DNA helicase PcrA
MDAYREALADLNDEQRAAVEQLDGPILVIAGPGTGKTQLISTRVGYILDKTDTPPDSVLLLTFTEAGVQAMRERLTRLIGKAAYDVQLNTYHAFGGEIFRNYPDYFEGSQLSLVEELSSDVMLRSIIAKLPYSNPLKFAVNYINDLKSFISDSKRALLSPEDIGTIARKNLETISNINKAAAETLKKLTTVSKKSVPLFEDLLGLIESQTAMKLPGSVLPLTDYAARELREALAYFERFGGKTTMLSEWKRRWLAKDEHGGFVIEGQRANQRLVAAAGIYKQYQRHLADNKLYDYDDMILRAIEALEANPELKYSLAEHYNYILLDEFQDTNAAQFRLVQLLTDHPVNEGRPNILAVGDDDQAIYAFQGAEHANMASFAKHYTDVKLVSLKQNYRSHQELLDVGKNIAQQLSSRLHDQFEGIEKELIAANDKLTEGPYISFRQFAADTAQLGWVADEIKGLIDSGIPAHEIAVLAPKHRYLQPLLPYLSRHHIPVRYERRENVLDEPLILQLERMSQLVLALADGDETLANSIWPEVLSYDFWQVPTEKIWRNNWQVRESHEPWTAQLLNDETHSHIAALFLKLASLLSTTTLEQQLDLLIGVPDSAGDIEMPARSPMYDYYFSKQARKAAAADFTKLISDLNLLRSRLRDWRRSEGGSANLRQFVEFAEGHRAAGINILNTSPYHETTEAVNLLTAYGAKGREFQAVFIVAALDEVWGSASRNQGYRLSLPANLGYIRYQGASEDERLRLLYVAATRARARLYFTSYLQDLAGKNYTPLKYMDIEGQADGRMISRVLPMGFQEVQTVDKGSITTEEIRAYWQEKHLPPLSVELRQALAPRLESYRLNPTDLNKFTDIVNDGPESFFMGCFLRFPTAPSIGGAYGTAIHNSLRFIGRIAADEGNLPDEARIIDIFTAQISRTDIPTDEQTALLERGSLALHHWLSQRAESLRPTDRYEYNFRSEGSISGDARLGGVVDRMIIDEKSRTITVVDYKVGQSYSRWQPGIIKLHNFRKQLLFYKLLIESSARFRKYRVTRGVIEFVEPDEKGKIRQLELEYDESELLSMVELINGVWRHVQSLELPDTKAYSPSLAGIRKFEEQLTQNQNGATK